MKTINLTNIDKSDIKYDVSRFPDGDIRFEITGGDFNRKDEYNVICRIRNAEELYLLSQVCDILNTSGVVFNISILYLMGARMDRIIDFNKPFTLKIISKAINSFKANKVTIVDVHSEIALKLIKNSKSTNVNFNSIPNDIFKDNVICFPDAGAAKRYGITDEFIKEHENDVIICEKERDKNGKLVKFNIKKSCNVNGRNIELFDDLCDGGGTFIGLAELLRPLTTKLTLTVTHAIQKNGLEKIANVFDFVIISNSFCDWDKEILPKNVIVDKLII